MADNPIFRTPTMERAAALAVIVTACDVVEGVEADKHVVGGYHATNFDQVKFQWANVMTGFHQFIDGN